MDTTKTAGPIPDTTAIIGLAVDEKCVSFWSSNPPGGGSLNPNFGSIRVAPK